MAGTITCPFPSDLSTLSNVGFQFSINKLPELTYFCQSVNLPEINLPSLYQATPFSNPHIAGDKLEFQPLRVEFLVNSTMENYKAIHNWLVQLGFPESYEQYNLLRPANDKVISELATNYSDATLTILNSSNTKTASLSFVDIVPTSLSTINFDSRETDIKYVVGIATFDYSYYFFN